MTGDTTQAAMTAEGITALPTQWREQRERVSPTASAETREWWSGYNDAKTECAGDLEEQIATIDRQREEIDTLRAQLAEIRRRWDDISRDPSPVAVEALDIRIRAALTDQQEQVAHTSDDLAGTDGTSPN